VYADGEFRCAAPAGVDSLASVLSPLKFLVLCNDGLLFRVAALEKL
jgi:hypothetical protein